MVVDVIMVMARMDVTRLGAVVAEMAAAALVVTAVVTAAAVVTADRSGCVQCCRIYKFAAPQNWVLTFKLTKGLFALEE